jgi:hypothetical protein
VCVRPALGRPDNVAQITGDSDPVPRPKGPITPEKLSGQTQRWILCIDSDRRLAILPTDVGALTRNLEQSASGAVSAVTDGNGGIGMMHSKKLLLGFLLGGTALGGGSATITSVNSAEASYCWRKSSNSSDCTCMSGYQKGYDSCDDSGSGCSLGSPCGTC